MVQGWPHLLRLARSELGITQRHLGELSGVSPETVRAYERGTRTPRRQHLLAIVDALNVDNAKRRAILEGAGFAAPATMFPNSEFPDFYFTAEQLQGEVETVSWPQFVLNDATELIAANEATQKVWGIDFKEELRKRSRPQLNLLSVASERRFADRMLNWDECVATLVGVIKGRPTIPGSLDEPDPYLNRVLEEFAKGDPAYLARLATAWASAPAVPAKTRWAYNVVWKDDLGVMHFHCLVSNASETESYSFNDWIPVDAETWTVLERVKSPFGQDRSSDCTTRAGNPR